MLKRSDLDAFVELARLAERETAPSSNSDPESLLRAPAPSDGLLHRNELTRLRCSLKIASVAGDVPDSAHRILHTIAQELSTEGFTYMALTRSKEWLEAIAWARLHPATPASDHGPRSGQDRQWVVGRACRALRERDYRVDIDALGPGVDADTRTEIAREVDSLFAQMGGISAAEQLFRILRDTRKVHAGMWLFGNIPAPDDQPPQPAVPFGWLFSPCPPKYSRSPVHRQSSERLELGGPTRDRLRGQHRLPAIQPFRRAVSRCARLPPCA